jgi:hypothetical protein
MALPTPLDPPRLPASANPSGYDNRADADGQPTDPEVSSARHDLTYRTATARVAGKGVPTAIFLANRVTGSTDPCAGWLEAGPGRLLRGGADAPVRVRIASPDHLAEPVVLDVPAEDGEASLPFLAKLINRAPVMPLEVEAAWRDGTAWHREVLRVTVMARTP